MAELSAILKDPNYVNANDATKRAIFDKYSGQDSNFTAANEATQAAIRQKFGAAMALPKEVPVVAITMASRIMSNGNNKIPTIKSPAGSANIGFAKNDGNAAPARKAAG